MTTSLRTVLRVAPLGLLFLVAGCGKSGDPKGGGAADAPVTAITITGDDRMRFHPTRFTVERGATVTITLHNAGTMPKESMGHNLVVLTPGTDPNGFAASSMRHPAAAYVAPELKDRVVAFTPVLGPGERHELVVTVPDAPGEYPFVCSFPGHTPAGMRGVMVVR